MTAAWTPRGERRAVPALDGATAPIWLAMILARIWETGLRADDDTRGSTRARVL